MTSKNVEIWCFQVIVWWHLSKFNDVWSAIDDIWCFFHQNHLNASSFEPAIDPNEQIIPDTNAFVSGIIFVQRFSFSAKLKILNLVLKRQIDSGDACNGFFIESFLCSNCASFVALQAHRSVVVVWPFYSATISSSDREKEGAQRSSVSAFRPSTTAGLFGGFFEAAARGKNRKGMKTVWTDILALRCA